MKEARGTIKKGTFSHAWHRARGQAPLPSTPNVVSDPAAVVPETAAVVPSNAAAEHANPLQPAESVNPVDQLEEADADPYWPAAAVDDRGWETDEDMYPDDVIRRGLSVAAPVALQPLLVEDGGATPPPSEEDSQPHHSPVEDLVDPRQAEWEVDSLHAALSADDASSHCMECEHSPQYAEEPEPDLADDLATDPDAEANIDDIFSDHAAVGPADDVVDEEPDLAPVGADAHHPFGRLELENVIPGNPGHVFCITCNKEIAFRTVVGHFVDGKQHKLPKADVRTWLSAKDGQTARNTKGKRNGNKFMDAWKKKEDASVARPTRMQSTPKWSAAPPQSLPPMSSSIPSSDAPPLSSPPMPSSVATPAEASVPMPRLFATTPFALSIPAPQFRTVDAPPPQLPPQPQLPPTQFAPPTPSPLPPPPPPPQHQHRTMDELALPKVTIRTDAQEWKAEMWNDDAERHAWPIKGECDLPDTKNFSRHMAQRGKDDSTEECNEQGLGYLWSMLEIDGPSSFSGVLVASYQDGTFSDLFDMPLLNPKYSWTRKIVQAIKHLCAHSAIDAAKRAWPNVERVIRLLQQDMIEPLLTSCNKEAKVRGDLKEAKDTEYLDKLPPINKFKEGIKEAMIHIWAIHRAFELEPWNPEKPEKPEKLLYPACLAMLGICFNNAPAGRPGEWARLTMGEMRKFIADPNAWYIRCSKHKTSKTYGETGKFIPPGTRRAMELYLGMRSEEADDAKFFRPKKQGTDKINVSGYLKTFYERYVPDVDRVNPTLLRKFLTTTADDDVATARRIAAAVNQHSEATARRNYTLRKAEKDAKSGRAACEGVLEGPVPWPDDSELTEAVYEIAINKMLGYDEDEGDQCEEEVEDEDASDHAEDPPKSAAAPSLLPVASASSSSQPSGSSAGPSTAPPSSTPSKVKALPSDDTPLAALAKTSVKRSQSPEVLPATMPKQGTAFAHLLLACTCAIVCNGMKQTTHFAGASKRLSRVDNCLSAVV